MTRRKKVQSVEFLNQSPLKPSGKISIRKSTRLQFIVVFVSTCFGPLGQTAHWTTQAAPAWHHASVLLQYLQAGNNCHCYGLFMLNYNRCNVPQPTQILCLNSCPQFSLPHKKLAVFEGWSVLFYFSVSRVATHFQVRLINRKEIK